MSKQLYHFNLLTFLLLPLSAVYWVLYRFHRSLYRVGILKSFELPVPVVVIGNITVGGTGKTPLVAWLATTLDKEGYRPGIVLRGYKGSAGDTPTLVNEKATASTVGDEAVLLAKTGFPVCVGKNRVSASRKLVAEEDCNIIISDDGLQHYQLERDIEIAVIDGQRRFGNGLLLPAGPLRESVSRLKSVDYVLCRGGNKREGEIAYSYKPTGFRNLVTGEIVDIDQFQKGQVNAVAAIGNPAQFYQVLEDIGFEINNRSFPDHHAFVASDLEFDNDLQVIMTEKDAVKCGSFARGNYWALAIGVSVPGEFTNALLNKIKLVVKNG